LNLIPLIFLQPCATATDVEGTVMLPSTPRLIVQGNVDVFLILNVFCQVIHRFVVSSFM